jgi:peptidoglycan/xylan/chitin deacetylase (PgdA/CDA1 family)
VAPGRRIALTFDDGPDPRWTPRIAAELRRLHVPATFFVVGSEVVRHPDLVRSLHRQGFELGNHTFTHADVSTLPGWEQRLQTGLTDNALAGTVGVRPRLFRPPYSSVPGGVSAGQARASNGSRAVVCDIVLTDYDGEDWQLEFAIVAAARLRPARRHHPPPRRGGDRSVARSSSSPPAHGFRFVTVSQPAGLHEARRRSRSIARPRSAAAS